MQYFLVDVMMLPFLAVFVCGVWLGRAKNDGYHITATGALFVVRVSVSSGAACFTATIYDQSILAGEYEQA